MKHADACCGTPFTPMLNHTGELNDGALVDEDVLELVAERLGLVARRRSSRRVVPQSAIGVDDAVDHLAQRPLALGRAERAAEVLLGDDVRGVQRPGGRELDPGLEEGVAAVLVVLDARVAPLPLDGVVRIDAGRVKRRLIPIPSCCGAIAMFDRLPPSRLRAQLAPDGKPLHLVVPSHPDREMGVHYTTVIPRVSTLSGMIRTLRPSAG